MGIMDKEELEFMANLNGIRRKRGTRFWGALLLLSVVFAVGGCAQLKKDLKDGITQFVDEFNRGMLENREGAIKKFGYTGKQTEIIVESILITPYTVKPGDQWSQELKYALLSPEPERNFLVVEKVIFAGSRGEKIDLLISESKKDQGVHLLTFKVTVPLDIESGEYHIISTISTLNQSKTAKGYFFVKK